MHPPQYGLTLQVPVVLAKADETAGTVAQLLASPDGNMGFNVWLQESHVPPDEDGLGDGTLSTDGTVTIRWQAEDEFLSLHVIDSGIGIEADKQDRLFERFYRVDKARSRELGGTGLGLSIVKHLAQFFGGTVGVSSQHGKGSDFWVRLPRIGG